MRSIDPGQPESWPSDVTDAVNTLAERCLARDDNPAGSPSCELLLETVDAPFEAETEFRTLLGPRPVSLFHATRLLPHELLGLLADGLRCLEVDHRRQRIMRAAAAYPDALDATQAMRLIQTGPLIDRMQREARLGKLHGVTPLHDPFISGGPDMSVFLENWGGESIYWAGYADPELETPLAALVELSEPVIVDVAVRAADLCAWHSLWKVFVGQAVGCWADPWTEFSVTTSVPPERILEVLTPSSPRWPIPAGS